MSIKGKKNGWRQNASHALVILLLFLYVVCVISVVLLFIAHLGHAQRYMLQGAVLSAQGPVAGASVYLYETRQGVASGRDGTFTLQDLKNGQYTLYVSAIGYVLHTANIYTVIWQVPHHYVGRIDPQP